MSAQPASQPFGTQPTFADLFTPKFVTVMREGYTPTKFRADALAAVTVAVVALPLSMAISIASGAPPERGIFTAIVGGFLISLLGGSRFQIGGPAGAFIVLVAATIERFGLDGLALASFMAGLILIIVGYLRIGSYMRYIPHPVIIGFTAGIAVIIFSSQLHDLLGLTLAGKEPGAFIPKLEALWGARSINPWAIAVAAGSLAIIIGLRRWRPHWPGFLIAIVAAGLATWLFGLPVETIAQRFGAIPRTLPSPSLPEVSLARIGELLPSAMTIALLGGIESLLSAMVADGMTGRRHRSNCELVAQGAANMASALFGGLCATGTIARTATNIRAGAVGPVSGVLHSVFLLLMMLVAAPLMGEIPLAALAAILAVVCWNMAEKHEFIAILRRSRGDAAVLLATFLITVFRDLTEGIGVGVVMGSLLFMHRMAELMEIEAHAPLLSEDRADNGVEQREASIVAAAAEGTLVYRFAGPLFFGTASTLAAVLDRIGETPKRFVLDMSAVPMIDHTGAITVATFADRAKKHGAAVVIAAAAPNVRRALAHGGLRPPRVTYAPSVTTAIASASSRSA
ncbi:SulP family inorganic anion transporter [Terrarubrum flagellatum]|uniref:SulP family inorganic anion transporter n=1 Tax=Terrirubrum flagellatum TaxID=2895980 RepID=UPI003144F49F